MENYKEFLDGSGNTPKLGGKARSGHCRKE